jgi:cell division protein ZapA
MPEIEIAVNGRNYRLVCEPGEETHLEQLAEYVRDRAEKVPRGPGVTEAQALLMAGIMVADDLSGALDRVEELEESANRRGAEAGAAHGLLENAARRIEELAGRIRSA